MADSAHLISVLVGTESSFGSVDPSTGLPSWPGGTSLECERASLETFGETPQNERSEARDGPHDLPPEPDTVWAGGARVHRRTGEIMLACPVTGVGDKTVFATHAAMPFWRLLASAMWDAGAPSASADVVTAPGSATSFVSTLGANYRIGDLIGVNINGRFEVAGVTDLSGPGAGATVTHSPAFSAGLTVEEVRMLRTLYIDNALNMAAAEKGASVALRIDGVGMRSYAYGCRAKEVRFYRRGAQLMCDVTLQAAYVVDDHAVVTRTEPARSNAAPVHQLNCFAVVSGDASDPLTPPAALARNVLPLDDFELKIAFTLTPVGSQDSVLGMSDLSVDDVQIECNLTVATPSSVVDGDFLARRQRSLIFGFAGELDSEVEEGNGAALYLPGAVLKTDPRLRDRSEGHLRQRLTYGAGRFAGDDAGTKAANSIFRFGMAV